MSLFGDIGKFVGVEGPGSHAQSQQVSTSTSVTNNTDKRQVLDAGGGGAVGISSDSSTITFNALDENAVNNAVDLAANSSDTAYKSLVELLGLSKDLVKLEGATATHIQDAYQGASDSAAGVRQISVVGLIVVGLVVAVAAYAVLRKG